MKKVIVFAVMIAVAATAFAQKPTQGNQGNGQAKRPQTAQRVGEGSHVNKAIEWKKQMAEKRKTYIMEQMGLTEKEKTAFGAIYDEHLQQMDQSKKRLKGVQRQLNDSLSEELYVKYLDAISAEMTEQANCDKAFYEKMRKILPAKKIYLYYEADKSFNKLMLKDMRTEMQKMKK